MHKRVAGMRMCIQHLLPVMLPGVLVACSFPFTYYASSANFPLYAPLTPLIFLVTSVSSASSLFSALPTSSSLSVPLLHTNLDSIYHYRKYCLSACPTILKPSQ